MGCVIGSCRTPRLPLNARVGCACACKLELASTHQSAPMKSPTFKKDLNFLPGQKVHLGGQMRPGGQVRTQKMTARIYAGSIHPFPPGALGRGAPYSRACAACVHSESERHVAGGQLFALGKIGLGFLPGCEVHSALRRPIRHARRTRWRRRLTWRTRSRCVCGHRCG